MKFFKFMLLLVIGLLVVNVSHTKADTTSTNIDKWVAPVSVDMVYDDFKSLAKSAGIKLDSVVTKATRIAGETISNLWEILVQQQRVRAYTYLFILLLSLFTIYSLIKFGIHRYLMFNEEQNIGDADIALMVGIIIVVGLLVGYNYSHLMIITTGLFNPEYGALQELYKIANAIIQ